MKLTYRPEIDGLRAIAVLAVIFYHAQLEFFGYNFFKGGFIGVDIFFVISGYLIGSLIIKELELTNNFSFMNFYERRARRILPALFSVLVISFPFALYYILPNNFVEFAKSSIYSLFFGSNFYFHYSGLVYGAEDGLLKPLLHTWSLSVEEQFYLIFPIFLLLIYRFFRDHLLKFMVIGFLFSLILSDWQSKNNTSSAFYFLHYRMWELLAGAILARMEIKLGFRSKNKLINEILTILGFTIIILFIVFYNEKLPYLSFYTLLPIFGACTIVWCAREDVFIGKILSLKLLVWTGLISYSLYLWHYPILAFSRINEIYDESYSFKIILFVLIIFLSIISYFFVEKPFRNKSKISKKKLLIYLLSSLLLLLIVNLYSISQNGRLHTKNTAIEDAKIDTVFDDSKCKFSSSEKEFFDYKFQKRFTNCLKEMNKPFVLLLGDSHSIDLYNSLSKLSNYDFIINLYSESCRPPGNEKCIYLSALDFVREHKDKIRVVFFNHKGSYYLTDISEGKASSNSGFRKLPTDLNQITNTLFYIKLLQKHINDVIFVGPHIEPNIKINKKIWSKLNKNYLKDRANLDLINADQQLQELSKLNNINYISKITSIEYDIEKDFFINNKFTFSDTDHWSEFGEIYFGKKLFSHPMLIQYLK